MRWTLRGIDTETRAIVREIAELNGITHGDCVNEAVELWFSALLEDDEEEDVEELAHDFSEG